MQQKNKIRCHSKLDLESSTLAVSQQQQQPAWKILKQVQDDGLICYNNNNNGFTLIELLVVVLIIGILAAVALPQYQKAVEKSRATQALTLLKSVAQAAESYYLANGTEFTSFDELSLDIPWTGNTQVVGQAQESKSNTEWSLEIEQSSTVNATTLFITRLDGKYQGAGFAMTLNDPDGLHHSDLTILCFERKTGASRTFDTSLAAGAYCAQIIKGSPRADNPETQYARYYTLP